MNSYSASSISRRGLIAGVAVAAAALAGCSGGEKDGSATGSGTASGGSRTLRVAMELAYPPFEGKDSAGNPAGVWVYVMHDFTHAEG